MITFRQGSSDQVCISQKFGTGTKGFKWNGNALWTLTFFYRIKERHVIEMCFKNIISVTCRHKTIWYTIVEMMKMVGKLSGMIRNNEIEAKKNRSWKQKEKVTLVGSKILTAKEKKVSKVTKVVLGNWNP